MEWSPHRTETRSEWASDFYTVEMELDDASCVSPRSRARRLGQFLGAKARPGGPLAAKGSRSHWLRRARATPAFARVPSWRAPLKPLQPKGHRCSGRAKQGQSVFGVRDEAARSLSEDVQAELLLRFFAVQGP